MNLKKNFNIVVILLFTITLQATNYYVNSSTGNDTFLGDQNQPWKTIQKAANTLVAGDTVFIMAGTYTPTQKIEFLNSGTSNNYINYLAYPGDEQLVIIDGVNVLLPNWFGVFSIISKNYIKISGLKVINSSYAGFYVDLSTNIIIKNNHTYQTQSSGISVWDCDLIIIDNNDVSRACWPTGGMQECISIVKSNRVLVQNNHVYNGGSINSAGGGEGIDIKDGCTNSIVYNNVIHDVASVGIYIDAYLTNQSNIYVFKNVVYNILLGVGISVASEEGGSLDHVIVSNNTISNCDDRGMVIQWTNKPDYLIKNIFVHHNTFYSNSEGLDVGLHTLGNNINITNNIFSQNLVYQMQNSSVDFNLDELILRNNLLDGINPSWALTGENFILENPNFINAQTNDYHLENNSPAINQGAFLTKTTNTGTGTVIQLEDAGFFTNGYSIKEGNFIQIEGQTQQFEIIAINYLTNTITLNETASWNIGNGISLAYNDNAPDIGAFEFNDSLGLTLNTIDNLVIYPNPTNDVFYVSDKYLTTNYSIISLNGKILKEGKINTTSINVSDLKAGIYVLNIKTNSNNLVFRLIKK